MRRSSSVSALMLYLDGGAYSHADQVSTVGRPGQRLVVAEERRQMFEERA